LSPSSAVESLLEPAPFEKSAPFEHSAPGEQPVVSHNTHHLRAQVQVDSERPPGNVGTAQSSPLYGHINVGACLTCLKFSGPELDNLELFELTEFALASFEIFFIGWPRIDFF
jgi:hypothetical protein